MTDSAIPSFLAAGSQLPRNGGSIEFVRIAAGEPAELILLTGVEPPEGEKPNGSNSLISYQQYTAWVDDLPEGTFSPSFPATGRPDDPGRIIGLEPKFRGLMIVATTADPTTPKLLSFGKQVFRQLVELEAGLGEPLKGRIVRIVRKGEGMSTRYSVINTGKSVDIEGDPGVNIVDHIGSSEPDDVIESLRKVGLWTAETDVQYEGILEAQAAAAKAAASKASGKKKPAAPKAEETDWELSE